MSAPTLVILNPASAGGSVGAARGEIEGALRGHGVEFELRTTTGPGDAEAIAVAAAREGRPRVVAAGGDGTVHEVANGLLSVAESGEALPELGVLPVGTGNDFFRMVDAPATVEAAAHLLARGRCRSFDAGRVRWEGGVRHFVNLVGTGIDVAVLRQRGRFQRLRGLPQYVAALAVAAIRYRPVPLAVALDGTDDPVPDGPTLLAAATVGPSVGAGFHLSPGARPDDGLLDLCHVTPLGYWRIMRTLPRVLDGRHTELDEVRLRTFRRAIFRTIDGSAMAFELDGELAPWTAPELVVEIVPGALRVVARSGGGER